MKRPLFLLFFFFSLLACDPDLTPPAKAGPGDAAKEVGAGEGPGPTTGDAGDDEGGTDAGADVEDDTTGVVTHKIDGDNDFKPGEHFVTSSTGNGYEGFIGWDATFIYVGMSGADVGSGDSKKWLLVYLSGASGTTTGQKYGATQQPTLPFSAEYHVRWKADGSYTNGQHWGGSSWDDATGLGFVPVAAKKGTFVEMAIKRSSIGNPTNVKLVMVMINETSGNEWTFSSVPSTAITDGLNPNYAKYFDFDLSDGVKSPNQYAALP